MFMVASGRLRKRYRRLKTWSGPDFPTATHRRLHHGCHRLAGFLEAAANAVILLGTLADLSLCRVGDTVFNQLLPRGFVDVAVGD
ncbi:hypothetical protein [Pseudomonas cedrina]|uniref:hypothetical protein n=1 Tax=Pseudomonas cedrina TaxID=651740 RepID=UPI00278A3AC9|nr:hypothetical protein [Pseudomonas cedrina]MDQ0651387.1 hypothetical protein [Pseudomonas cedrina]